MVTIITSITNYLFIFVLYTSVPLIIRFIFNKRPLGKDVSIVASIFWIVFLGIIINSLNNYNNIENITTNWYIWYIIFSYGIFRYKGSNKVNMEDVIVDEKPFLYHKIFNYVLLPFIFIATIDKLISYFNLLGNDSIVLGLIYFLYILAVITEIILFYGLLKFKKNSNHILIILSLLILPEYIIAIFLTDVITPDRVWSSYFINGAYIIFFVLSCIYYAKRSTSFINAWVKDEPLVTKNNNVSFCRKCGQILVPLDSKFCQHCGTEVILNKNNN